MSPNPLSAEYQVDRAPVPGRNLPYSPADGSVVTVNPPPFLWLPSGHEVTYRLQVDETARFDGPRLLAFAGDPWCCEMLTKPLAPGVWYWRYGVDRPGLPTVWSKARRFKVPENARLWPYPGREALKAPDARPHLFVKPDQVTVLRKRATHGDLKEIATRLTRGVKKHVGEVLPPEPAWLPKDPAERGKAYTVTFRTTRPPMDVMERAALAYLLTGDTVCGAEAKRRLLHFFSWDPHGPTNVFHNDEPAMWVMMRGVRAYDWTYDLFTPEERSQVEPAMRIRAADFYKKMRAKPFENNPFESHAGRIIGFLGEAAIEFLSDWPEAQEWLDYITRIFWGVYPAWGKDDGGWNEGPGYWSAYMNFALHFVLALREATGIDVSHRPFFRNTPYYRFYLTPPFSQMAPFGDGTQWKPNHAGTLLYWFSTLNRDPYLRWYADSLHQGPGAEVLGVLLKDDGIAARPPTDLPPARLFPGVGLVCLHTDLVDGRNDVAFALRSSPYGAVSHGHNDQNCFVLEAYGEPLAIASGYYNRYGSPHHTGWTQQTKAKCGITCDGGRGQDRGWHARGKITAFLHGERFDLVCGDATKAYGGRWTRAIREVVHVRPGLFVIRDDLAAAEPHRYEFRLHSLERMELDEVTAKVRIRRPKASLLVQFLLPENAVFSQTDRFDPPPVWPPGVHYANNWHFVASVPKGRKEAQFLTVLLPVKAAHEDDLPKVRALSSETAVGVELSHADGAREVVGFAAPDRTGTVSLADIETDARVFAVALTPADQPTAYLVLAGRRLEVRGRRLVSENRPVTATSTLDPPEPGGPRPRAA